MSKRRYLAILLAVALVLGLAPAGFAQSATYQEAPMLTEMVAAGTLPPVGERLPESPVVVTPHDQVGVYGQTMYSAFPSAYQWQAFETAGFYEPVLTWNADNTALMPNLVEAYEPSADATTVRMTIRKGLKWSDGTPVTTEDVRFAYEDMWKNAELNPTPPTAFTVDGELCGLNIIDDRTFELTFKKPYPSLQYQLCRQGNTALLFVPSTYLKQFHKNYIDQATLDKLTSEGGFDTWVQMFGNKNTFQINADRPCLFAWHIESISDDGLVRKMVRNPYYFKVDTAGNQLPYLDYQQIEYVDNLETLNMKTLAGENEYIYAPPGE